MVSLKNRAIYRLLQLSNVKLYNWLFKQGLFPAKTYTIGTINIPNKYFMDFLRGHLDGDGSIVTYIDSYMRYKEKQYINIRLFTKFISASYIHIIWLQSKIFEISGLKGAIIRCNRSKSGRHDIWELKYSKKESLILLKFIYYKNDLLCLERKQLIANNFIN